MKRRIEQLLNGKFEYRAAKLLMDPQEVRITVQPGEHARGSFRLSAASGKKIRGFLYSSSPRMLFEPSEFQGVETEIRYQADASGMTGGMTEQGAFCICSELGEYRLPFTIEAVQAQETEREPAADRAQALAELAQQDYQKAYRCFITREFRDKLAANDPKLLGLYESIAKASFHYQSMESFLIGAGLKRPVEFAAEVSAITQDDLSEPVMKSLRLTRSGWGFVRISAGSDAPFLRLERTLLTTDDFAGSSCDLRFLIDTNRMHAGKNYGRIHITAGAQTIVVEVTARKAGGIANLHQTMTCKKMRLKLERLYIAFRLQKLDLETWISRSQKALGSYTGAGGADPFADLFQAQLSYAEGQKQKALRILDGLQAHPERLQDVTRYGFYLYLTTFLHQEDGYVDQTEAQITRLFEQNPSNWVLQWILLYLNEALMEDDEARYQAVSAQFERGCRSRILYVEAYEILRKHPFFMRRIGDFERSLLRFAVQEEVLTEEMLQQAMNLAEHTQAYHRTLFQALAAGYEQFPSKELLRAVCVYLIKGDKKEPEYFKWYERGVREGLRITGLYEYYLASTTYTRMEELPQIIQMYFAYDSQLSYRKRAGIYYSVLLRRDEDPQMYRTHRAAMQKFALEQLEAGRLTDALAGLYRGFLRRDILTDAMAEKLLRLLCSYEVVCSVPGIKTAVVHSPCCTQEEVTAFRDGKARVQIYDPTSVLLVSDENGDRYPAGTFCEIRPLFLDESMVTWCLERLPESAGALLYVSSRSLEKEETRQRELPFLQKAERSRRFTDPFRARIRKRLLDYYQAHMLDDTLSDYIRTVNLQEFVQADKTGTVVLLAEEGLCEEAFALLDRYGAEGIPMLQLVRICSRMVIASEFEENRMLLSLCHTCFASGKYNDKLLRYLLLYYEGPVREMEKVWRAGCEFELDTLMIEEKIMMTVLFTRSQTQETEPVFEAYLKKMGRRKLCRAYVNLRAYEYFVRGQPVGGCVFQFIEREYESLAKKGRQQEQEDVCRLALLQYYASRPSLSVRQEKQAGQLLEAYHIRGMHFAFWKKFPDRLLAPYQMAGRVFVEYVCDPACQVSIFYREKGTEEYQKEAVRNYFEGIFVKEFTLFEGEELECYLEEQSADGIRRTDLRLLTAAEKETGGYTQYDLLNRIGRAGKAGDDQAFREELENYLLQEYLAKELFTLI